MVISSFRGLPIAMDLISVLILQGGLSKNGAGQVVEVQWRTHCGWEAVNRRWEVVNRRWEVAIRRWEVAIRRWEVVILRWKAVFRRWEAEQAVAERLVREMQVWMSCMGVTAGLNQRYRQHQDWNGHSAATMHYSAHLVRHIPPQDVSQTSAFLHL